ncbi:MAG: PAS domain S-box protein, partial [Halovenus sp.]
MSDDDRYSGPAAPTLLADLVERAGEGLFAIDTSGRLTVVNSSFAELLGYEREQLQGVDATEIFP